MVVTTYMRRSTLSLVRRRRRYTQSVVFMLSGIFVLRTLEVGKAPLSLNVAFPEASAVPTTIKLQTTASNGLPRRMIATCVAGELRTFVTSPVRLNIAASLQVVENRTHVFVAVRTAWKASALRDLFAPLRPVALVTRTPLTDRLDGLRSHTACWPSIVARETARRQRYTFVLRVRPDVVYADVDYLNRLPDWPRPAQVFVEACGERVTRGYGPCRPRIAGRWGCAKDTWGLMGRHAATAYFALDAFGRVQTALCARSTAECLLGCAVYQRDPTVQFVAVPLHRQIVRAHSHRPSALTVRGLMNHKPRAIGR